MANNYVVLDGNGTSVTKKATDSGGVLADNVIVDSLPANPFGANADAAVSTDTTGSISGKMRGLVKIQNERTPASLGQKTKANSFAVVLASDQDALSISAITAGETHLGEVGGRVKVVDCAPTINPAAYATADVIGTKVTVSTVTRIAAGSGIIRSATLSNRLTATTAVDVILFDADPSASTFTDNAAVTVNVADLTKIIGVLSFVSGEYVSFAGNGVAVKQGLNIGFKLASGSDLYAVFVSRAAPTFANAADLNLRLAIEQN
jgi:hypothetical protein